MQYNLTEPEQFIPYLDIDKHNLDEEMIRHPMLMQTVSEAVSEAVNLREVAKQDVQTVYAALYLNEKDGSDRKLTEEMTKQIVLSKDEYIEACTRQSETKLLADQWLAIKEAMSTKGHMMKYLAELFIADYWALSGTKSDVSTNVMSTKVADMNKADMSKSRLRRRRTTQDQT